MAKTLISESGIQNYFWAEAACTTYYILSRAYIRKVLNKIPYELWKGGKRSVSHFHIFGCTHYILNNKETLGSLMRNQTKQF